MTEYVALLRGINVGGHNKIKMEDLRREFAFWGFENVRTLLASGNVVFDTEETQLSVLASSISERIKENFKMDVGVVIRTLEEIKRLADSDPFCGVSFTPQTRLYVTFLSDGHRSTLKVPYQSPESDFRILCVSGRLAL